MLGIHILLAVGLAAFADSLSPLGVVAAFVVSHLALRLAAPLLGVRRYLRQLELGAAFAAWFVVAIFRASIHVAGIVFGRAVRPRPAIVKLKLLRADDRIATLLGCLLTLTPGTVAIDYLPEAGLMYIHALDADDAGEVEAGVREIERRLLRWLDAGESPPEDNPHDE
ncbi:MAG: cation:proton antiporter [Thauera phenolivorans]|uniref:Cation:proton antiporter n=1 Tax=Thauera phenolivorans TaxID=1792543 RepID=A0A7X7LVA6_9RHOO|nr:Na+/H+ antiporter subunit E [Thauera phenolivorans]NLF53526.1 cation:proton antiporter [Thauera phenolivorans]